MPSRLLIPRSTLHTTLTLTEDDHPAWQSLHPVLQRLYRSRGVNSYREVEYSLKNLLPFDTLKGIEAAAQLLFQALQEKWRILIVGDFDADGATSSALAVKVLRAFGAAHVDYLVPNRFTYGYGLTPGIVELAITQKQPNLIITVDNGIASHDGVSACRKAGIKVLITDHHLPSDHLPAADVIVNPNQPEDHFPSKNLAGVGVIFYTLLALRRFLITENWFSAQGLPEPNMARYLDLVALGTVADVVALDANNRTLVSEGLHRIRASSCSPGILALLKIAGRTASKLNATDLGFSVAPRLNAAGRLEDMSLGIECLLSENEDHALELATRLDHLNHERRSIEADMSEQAFEALKHFEKKSISTSVKTLPLALCLFEPSWHQGVIGLLASRVKEKYHRPTIAFAQVSENELKGSARSIAGLHIRDILDRIAKRAPEILSKFGGHAMAAGLSLRQSDLPLFEKLLCEEVEQLSNEEILQNKLYSDGALDVREIHLNVAKLLEAAGPWGQNFPEPLFEGIFALLDQRLVGQKHLKMILEREGKQFDAIAFQVDLNAWPNTRCEQVKIAYRLGINAFRNLESVQLVVEYLEAL